MERGVRGLVALFLFIFLCNFVVADVAYVLKDVDRNDSVILDVFDEMGLDVDLIESRDVRGVDFSGYDFIFIGDDRLRNVNMIPVDEFPSVIMNRYYGEKFGLTDRQGISQLANNNPLLVKKQNQGIQVYDRADYKRGGVGIPYYYLPVEHKEKHMSSVATTAVGYNTELGDVISYSSEGAGKCFFGIAKTEFWTEDAKNLFVECVDFVRGREMNHDVLLDEDFEDSVNGIRIEDVVAEEFLELPILRMCTEYEFKVNLKNVGNYVEDVSVVGTISGPGSFEDTWTGSRSGLNPGSYTTVSGKHSEDFCEGFSPGSYTLNYEAQINNDENPGDNVLEIAFQLIGNQTELPESGWYCANDGEVRDDCFSLSSGLGTRCYLDEEKTAWETCSSGWIVV